MAKLLARSENLRCIVFMVIAMAGFAVEDAVIKRLSEDMPISQILALIGSAGMIVFSLLGLYQREQIFSASVASFWFIVRSLSELFSAIFFVIAIVYASLSSSSAILQATPLVVTLAAAVFFKQQVTLWQWMLIILGFGGVICVIQPGMDEFKPASLFAVLGVLFLGLRDTITRISALFIPTVTICFWAFFALSIAGCIIIPFFTDFVPVTGTHLCLLLLSAFSGSVGYYSVVIATSGGDVALVSPFRYTRLFFALFLGVFFFDEQLNLMMLFGSGIIISSGILILIQTTAIPAGPRLKKKRS